MYLLFPQGIFFLIFPLWKVVFLRLKKLLEKSKMFTSKYQLNPIINQKSSLLKNCNLTPFGRKVTHIEKNKHYCKISLHSESKNTVFKIPTRTNLLTSRKLFTRNPLLNLLYPKQCIHMYMKKMKIKTHHYKPIHSSVR